MRGVVRGVARLTLCVYVCQFVWVRERGVVRLTLCVYMYVRERGSETGSDTVYIDLGLRIESGFRRGFS